MLDALWTAASGMLAQQIGLDVIANNLANVNTVGFKASRAAFEDLLYNQISTNQGSTQGQQMGLGVGDLRASRPSSTRVPRRPPASSPTS